MNADYERIAARTVVNDRGCWVWQGASNQHGYGNIAGRHANGAKTCKRTHRVMWEAVHGPIEGGLHVLHTCDNPPCCNPDHLFLGTPLDNARDRQAKGRGRTGDQAALARRRAAARESAEVMLGVASVAARFDVSLAAVHLLVAGVATGHPSDPVAADAPGYWLATLADNAPKSSLDEWRSADHAGVNRRAS